MKEIEKHLDEQKVLKLSTLIILAIFISIIIWIFLAKINTSIQAPGEIIVKGYTKNISSSIGGKIKGIYVNEGSKVKKGDLLVEIDSSQSKIRLENANKKLLSLMAEKERILAELNNSKLIFSNKIPQKEKIIQTNIYKNRIKNLQETLKDIDNQIEITKQTIKTLQTTKQAKKEILFSLEKDLNDTKLLYNQKLIDNSKILSLKRQIIQTKGEIESIDSQIEENKKKIKMLEDKKNLIQTNYKKELLNKLAQINKQIKSTKSEINLYKDQIAKSKILSPDNGIIYNLKIHSIGETIQPYKTIMQLLPYNQKLIIKAQINPNDIEKIKVGDKAEINFISYINPAAKVVKGKVIYISANIITDEKDPKIKYYKALIEITDEGKKAIKENNYKIIPGMPVVVMIHTGKESVIRYILKPIEQLLKGAFYAN